MTHSLHSVDRVCLTQAEPPHPSGRLASKRWSSYGRAHSTTYSGSSGPEGSVLTRLTKMTQQQPIDARHARPRKGPETNNGSVTSNNFSSCAVEAEAMKSRSVPRCECQEFLYGGKFNKFHHLVSVSEGGCLRANPASDSQECASPNHGSSLMLMFALWFVNLIWLLVPFSWRRDKSLEKSEGTAYADNDLFKPFKSPLVHPKCGSCHIDLTELRCYHERRLRSKDSGCEPVQHASQVVDHVKHGPSHMLNPCSSTARSPGLSPSGFAGEKVQLLDSLESGGYVLIFPNQSTQLECAQNTLVPGSPGIKASNTLERAQNAPVTGIPGCHTGGSNANVTIL